MASTSGPSDGDAQNYFKSREKIFKKALSLLQQDRKAQVIALCGMGGVGKTTMMEQLKKAVEDKKIFDWVVKVFIGQKINILSIQQTMAEYIKLQLTETSKTARANHLRIKFRKLSQERKKVLVVLDDVWEKVDLRDIGLSPLPNGFKLLLTSRIENVCIQIAVEANSYFKVVRVDVMEKLEANNFFFQITGVSKENDPEFNDIEVEIVRRCGFLPLAIKLIARALNSQEKFVWRNTLHRLKENDFDENVQQIIEISYTFLKENEVRAVCLLCGLFPDDFDIPIEDLTRYAWGLKLLNIVTTLGDARDRTKTCVLNLKNANLLIDSDHSECVKMHDLVLAFVVAKFSKGDHPWIVNHGDVSNWSRAEMSESCRRISLTCTGMSEFPRDFDYPNVSLLRLMNGDESLEFPEDFYEKMRNLQVMACEKLQYPLLPRSLHCSTKLQTLCLHQCSLIFDCSPIGDYLLNLEVLSFAHSGIQDLPSAIGNLVKLKLLDLTGCIDLRIHEGVLENLVKLEELYMTVANEKGVRFTDINYKELEERSKNLSALEVEFFENNPQSKNISYNKLERFKISMGRFLKANSGKYMHSSENTLMLVANKDELLESGINELFLKTEVLHLEAGGMNILEEVLPKSGPQHSFYNLRVLCVSRCAHLRYLFTVPVASGLVKLERLAILECPVMEVLVYCENGEEGVIRFQELKHLYLHDLPMLVGLSNSNDVIDLPQLVTLVLGGLPNFTSIYPENKSASSVMSSSSPAIKPFFNKKGMIPRLEILQINRMESLKSIWPCGSSEEVDACLLRVIVAGYCDNLVNMFPSNPMPLLRHLQTIHVDSCGSIEVLFDIDVGCLGEIKEGGGKLRSIVVYSSGKLREVWRLKGIINPDHIICGFQVVERIEIIGCKRFRNIFTPTTDFDTYGTDYEESDIDYEESEEENNELVERNHETNFHGFIESDESMMRMLEKKGLLGAVSKATNHYHDRNIIKDGGSGKVYKGKLLWNGRLMYIAVWRLNRMYREKNYVEFRRELEFLSSLKHDNISSIFAYFDEDKDDENIIIYEHAFHGNLQGHLRNPALTWSRRLQICLGVARALNYIHKKGLIHCDINSSKILLDEDWEPKIFGFELCTEYFPSWMHRLHLSGYLDTTSVRTPKYDVHLFGVLLFEVLCGKKPMFDEDGFNGELDDIIDPSLREQIGSKSMKRLKKIAYNCVDKTHVKRPSMMEIVKELEEALELQHERSTNRDEGALWNRLDKNLEIPLREILLATDNFDERYVVGPGWFARVYKAKLDVLDIQSVSSIKGKSTDELPRIRKTVAIKRLLMKGDKQAEEGLLAEIELLSSCKHPNVVSLLGFSREANEMILVYEYALNGSLSDYLGSKLSLTWSQRIQICLQVAHGIKYLHTNMEGKRRIIHRDIKSENILLDENLNAKIADFGLSVMVGEESTILTEILAGTEIYIDPEYRMTGKCSRESDIYSFGVVLFEVLSGRMAYDNTYMMENDDGLAPIVRRRFDDGTLTELIDPRMLEDDEHTFTINRGPTQDSFNLFSKVGFECLAKTQAERPTIEVVIKTLQDALEAQGGTMVLSRFRLSSIELATQNFHKTYYMELDTYGKVYKAQLDHFESNSLLATEGKKNGEPSKKRINVVIKRISGRKDEHGEKGFFSEIEMHTRYKHPNIVPLLGFCYEGDNMLLVYEHASNESLDNYLRDTDNMTKYTWIHRLHHCLGIAHGLSHLHTVMDHTQEMIHVDIRSANILLGKSGEAKIAYFGLSKLLPTNQEASTDTTNNDVCRKVYCYPGYRMTRKLKKQSDIYSFGVVLFEIFCGRLAYDRVYTVKNDYGLAPIARQCFSDGTIKEMIDPVLKEETLEDILTSNREPISDSLSTYLKIADQCLAENQAKRPTMQIIIKELEMALNIQKNFIKNLQVSFKDVESATGHFSETNCVGSGRYWKAYKGELRNSNANLASASASDSVGPSSSAGPTASADPTSSDANDNTDFIVAKRWDNKSNQGDHQFRTEISIIIKRKHENIIGLVGYCHEMDERIIIYEQASKGSLDMYLNDATLTWMKRLKICMDVACALEFLHGGDGMLKKVVHRNIQSPAILLNDDWKAKISNLEMSSLDSLKQDMEHVSNNAYGAFGYLDPECKQGYLTEKSDIYSFGVIMFEILCGRLAWSEGFEDHSESLGPLAKRHYEEGKLGEMVFKGIKKQIGPESMAIYADIAYQCLHDISEKRPTAGEVVLQLKKALDLQDWETGSL